MSHIVAMPLWRTPYLGVHETGSRPFWIDPAKGIGGVYLTPLFPFADHKAVPHFLEFETAVYNAVT